MILQDFQSDNFEYESMNVVQMGQIILEPKGKLLPFLWEIIVITIEELSWKPYWKVW